jgi:hypothetical protein
VELLKDVIRRITPSAPSAPTWRIGNNVVRKIGEKYPDQPFLFFRTVLASPLPCGAFVAFLKVARDCAREKEKQNQW